MSIYVLNAWQKAKMIRKLHKEPYEASICFRMILYQFFPSELLHYLVQYQAKPSSCKSIDFNNCRICHFHEVVGLPGLIPQFHDLK